MMTHENINKVEEEYRRTVDYLFHVTPVFEKEGAKAYKSGMENSFALDAHFGHPHQHYHTIHVAGTNGKGSTSHTLAAMLQHAGYRVGLYTSPHMIDFRERIRVDGKPISQQRVIDFVKEEKHFFEPLHPSFFELTTALAFLYFKEEKVDVAVIEVGLGGRLDCTNVITPLLSVITNISMDHTQFLGNTLAQIAGEKAGIIKPSVPMVVGETVDETRPVFMEKAAKEHAPIHLAEAENRVLSAVHNAQGGMDYTTSDYGTLHGELGGDYQQRNTATVLSVVKHLNDEGTLHINKEDVAWGLAHVSSTGLTGRWQRLKEKPLTICDTGHNLGGWQWLSKQIAAVPCRERHIVFGMVDDKDVDHVMNLLPRDAHFYWTQPDNHRAIPVEKIAELGMQKGLKGSLHSTVSAAYNAAQAAANDDDFIFIGGSSYVVADLMAYLQESVNTL